MPSTCLVSDHDPLSSIPATRLRYHFLYRIAAWFGRRHIEVESGTW